MLYPTGFYEGQGDANLFWRIARVLFTRRALIYKNGEKKKKKKRLKRLREENTHIWLEGGL